MTGVPKTWQFFSSLFGLRPSWCEGRTPACPVNGSNQTWLGEPPRAACLYAEALLRLAESISGQRRCRHGTTADAPPKGALCSIWRRYHQQTPRFGRHRPSACCEFRDGFQHGGVVPRPAFALGRFAVMSEQTRIRPDSALLLMPPEEPSIPKSLDKQLYKSCTDLLLLCMPERVARMGTWRYGGNSRP